MFDSDYWIDCNIGFMVRNDKYKQVVGRIKNGKKFLAYAVKNNPEMKQQMINAFVGDTLKHLSKIK